MKKYIISLLTIILVIVGLSGCMVDDYYYDEEKINIITTTSIIADLARVIGGDKVLVFELMGSGIDPHSYNATAGDIRKIQQSDLVIYNGLDLEGKMEKVFANIENVGLNHLEIGSNVSQEKLIKTEEFAADPHIWFSISLWMEAADAVYEKIASLDEVNRGYFLNNKNQYLLELEELDLYIRSQVNSLKEEQRVLITAHDAFNYFGQEYGFEVIGLQGLSTLDETGIKRMSMIADDIVKREIKAIFIENSVPVKTIEALKDAVRARGFQVDIGGELYSDSLGTLGTYEGTYIGAFKANVDTIITGLR